MTDSLDIDRFRALGESYGADIRRWPAEMQEAAVAMAQTPAAIAILRDARELDALLDDWTVPPVGAELGQRVADTASTAGLNLLRRARMWWSGIGLAAALSGALAGSATTAVLMTPEHIASGTIFGQLDDDGDYDR